MKKFFRFFSAGLTIAMLLAPVGITMAQTLKNPGCPGEFDSSTGLCAPPSQTIFGNTTNSTVNESGILKILTKVTNWMFTGLLVLAVIVFIWAAYLYLFSGGDEEGTGKAKKFLLYGAIAIAIAMLSKGITFLVASILGVSSS
jgi:hypothetical protein